ncbi:MAG: SpoIIE family protein phosphatase [Brevinematales bacterium]|nr:SpoIIE family protein phosphatase [Brevinematales bacterium]
MPSDAITREADKQKQLEAQAHEGQNEKTHMEVIKQNAITKIHGEVVAKLISSAYYVSKNALVEDLAWDFDHYKSLFAVGVVDDNLEFLGIVNRRSLFDLLSKPYGRDVMKHRTVEKVVEAVRSFDKERNIYSISDELSDDIKLQTEMYYALTENGNKYYGIFSSRNMLVYLSSITQKDIALARMLQQSLVKEELLYETDQVKIFGASKMAKGVGGDYYNIKNYKESHWVFTVADVSGKGVAASLITTSISGMFEIYDFHKGMPQFIKKVNDYIQNSYESQKFVTGVFADLDLKHGQLVFYDMGHSYIYLYRKKKLFRLTTNSSNMPLGIQPLEPQADKLILHDGDILMIITDGIVEQTNPQNEEYGEKRIWENFIKYKETDIKNLKKELFADIKKFRATQPQNDDMTILFLEYKNN